MLNGQTFSSRTGKTSGLPKFELFLPIGSFLKIGKGIFRLLLPVIKKTLSLKKMLHPVIIGVLFIHNCDMEDIHVSGWMKRGLAET